MSETNVGPPAAKRGRPSNSVVHDYFEKFDHIHKKTKKTVTGCKCSTCGYVFTGTVSSTLKEHLRRKHPELFRRIQALDETSVQSLIAASDYSGQVSAPTPAAEILIDQEASSSSSSSVRDIDIKEVSLLFVSCIIS